MGKILVAVYSLKETYQTKDWEEARELRSKILDRCGVIVPQKVVVILQETFDP